MKTSVYTFNAGIEGFHIDEGNVGFGFIIRLIDRCCILALLLTI